MTRSAYYFLVFLLLSIAADVNELLSHDSRHGEPLRWIHGFASIAEAAGALVFFIAAFCCIGGRKS